MARKVELSTPLGDQLLFWRMTCTEALGQMFEIELDVLSKKPDIRPESLLGKSLTVSLNIDDERKRHFNGYAVRFAPGISKGKHFSYRLSLRPWLWFLTRTSDCKVFQNKPVTTVIDEVFSDEVSKAVDKQLAGDYKPWTYCVQYRETDFNFVSRLMEQEGIYYYFEHSEKEHKLILCDGAGSHKPIEGDLKVPFYSSGRSTAQASDHISAIGYTQVIQPGTIVMHEYDFVQPGADQKVTRKPEHTPEHSRKTYEIFDYPGAYDTTGEGDTYAAIRIEELAAQNEVFRGTGSERDMAVGRRFKLTDNSLKDYNIEYLVTETNIQIEDVQDESDSGGVTFAMQFCAIRSRQTFRPRRVAQKPVIVGVQTAVVTGPKGEEIFTDKHGRVKIQFHWDRYGKRDEKSSCFVRCAFPMAGKGWGMIAVPRIGHEVVVTFEEGDPDRPIITGSVYNGSNPGPFGTPAKMMVSGVKTNTHKGKGYNELAMDDTAGNELIRLHGQFDMDSTIEHDERILVKNNRTETVGVNESISIGMNRTETVGANESVTIGANRTHTVNASETLTVALQRTHTVGINETITIGAAQEITVGAVRALTVGASQTTNIGATMSESIGASRSESVGSDRSSQIGANDSLKVGSNRSAEVGSDDSLKVASNRTADVGADDSLTVAKNLVINAGDSVTITTGSASISMKKDGTIIIKGKDITIQGSGKINVKADSDIVMKGSKILQN